MEDGINTTVNRVSNTQLRLFKKGDILMHLEATKFGDSASRTTYSAAYDAPQLAIPAKLIKHIFSFISVNDMRNVRLVCRSFNKISQAKSEDAIGTADTLFYTINPPPSKPNKEKKVVFDNPLEAICALQSALWKNEHETVAQIIESQPICNEHPLISSSLQMAARSGATEVVKYFFRKFAIDPKNRQSDKEVDDAFISGLNKSENYPRKEQPALINLNFVKKLLGIALFLYKPEMAKYLYELLKVNNPKDEELELDYSELSNQIVNKLISAISCGQTDTLEFLTTTPELRLNCCVKSIWKKDLLYEIVRGVYSRNWSVTKRIIQNPFIVALLVNSIFDNEAIQLAASHDKHDIVVRLLQLHHQKAYADALSQSDLKLADCIKQIKVKEKKFIDMAIKKAVKKRNWCVVQNMIEDPDVVSVLKELGYNVVLMRLAVLNRGFDAMYSLINNRLDEKVIKKFETMDSVRLALKGNYWDAVQHLIKLPRIIKAMQLHAYRVKPFQTGDDYDRLDMIALLLVGAGELAFLTAAAQDDLDLADWLIQNPKVKLACKNNRSLIPADPSLDLFGFFGIILQDLHKEPPMQRALNYAIANGSEVMTFCLLTNPRTREQDKAEDFIALAKTNGHLSLAADLKKYFRDARPLKRQRVDGRSEQ